MGGYTMPLNNEDKDLHKAKKRKEKKASSEVPCDEGVPEEICSEGLELDVDKLIQERDEWKSKAETYWDQFLRARAEMDNFRKRTNRDFHDKVSREKAKLILSLLEVLDNFDRFMAAAEKNLDNGDSEFASFFKGIEMIQKQIIDLLEREGVTPIESSVGKKFDPYYHEAVFAQDGGGEHGTIVEEFQKGYMLDDTVLRPSRVKVIR